MTDKLEQAIDISVRLNTAIMALEAALPLASDANEPMAFDIGMALQFAQQALAVCKREAQQ